MPEDPFEGPFSNAWTYKCQAYNMNSDISLFEKSDVMVSCHTSHAIGFGIFLNFLYGLFGYSSSIGFILISLFYVLSISLLYFALRNMKINRFVSMILVLLIFLTKFFLLILFICLLSVLLCFLLFFGI